MKLWQLENNYAVEYSETLCLIFIRAESEEQARTLASDFQMKMHGEGGKLWKDPEKTTCVEVPLEGKPEVLFFDWS